MSTPSTGPRLEGHLRLVATSGPGEPVETLALDGGEVVVGASRRLALETLAEQPARPFERPAHARLVLEGGDQERLLALAPESGLAVSAFASRDGSDVRLHLLRSGTKRTLAVRQPRTLAASISPEGKRALILDEGGRVLCYELTTQAYPDTAGTRAPERGRPASVDLARGGRLWLAAAGHWVEVRLMSDQAPAATVDLAPLGDEVTCARFLPDASGFLAGTRRGVVLRFELTLDRVGDSPEARAAAISDAVDAAISGTGWGRYAPKVDVYDQRTESGRTTLYFVADHYEYHHAQSGSDWAEHYLCAGHATFEGDRRVEAQVATVDRRQLSESANDDYDCAAERAAFRAAAARARSASTVVRGADAIKRAFDQYFADSRMSLPEKALHQARGEFSDGGWDVRYRFGEDAGVVHLDVYAQHRLTNDRLYRVYADGRVELVAASMEEVKGEDRAFYDEVLRRFSAG